MPNVQPLTNGDPQRLGAYEVTGRLGEGGQGLVYLGRDATGPVAIKVLHAQLIEDDVARTRFLREVEVTKRVARFCTAQVLHTGMADDRPYIVSEYVPGPSLQQQLRQDGPRRGAALDRLAVNTATALAAIHQAGVVHRDFKPGNVLMGPDGPVVIDFGIARALDATGSTAASQIVGTPAFMAPEQLTEGRVGPATDMFAWGVTMVFAATGVPAFGNKSIPTVIHHILNEEPDLGDLDGRLRDIVGASLTKDPARRPTARQLMDALMGQGGATTLIAKGPAGPVERTPAAGPSGGATEVLPSDAPMGGATEVLPPAAPAGGGTQILPPASAGGGTQILPPTAPAGGMPGGTARLPASGPPMPPTRRMPAYDRPGHPMGPSGPRPYQAGGLPRPPAAPPRPKYAEEPPPRGRGAGGVIVAVIAVAVLLTGVGVVWAKMRSGGDGSGTTAAPMESTKKHHGPKSQRTSHRVSHRPPWKMSPTSRTPAGKKSAKVNPYTPAQVCGTGYQVVDRHGLGEATAYLLYDQGSGANCVVTMIPRSSGTRPALTASLQVQGGGEGARTATSPFYAGPVRLPAMKKCVRWGGSWQTTRWMSDWTHCG